MTDLIKVAILGCVEGLTEFLPISSTAHLIVASKLLNFHMSHLSSFVVSIQLGAILAVIFYERHFFMAYFSLKNWIHRQTGLILISTLPALVTGFFLYGFIKKYLFSMNNVIIGFIVGGLIILLFEKRLKKKSTTIHIKDMTYRQAFMVGIAQIAGLWPGMSRSGSAMMGGLFAGLDYKLSAQYSFIIAVPILSASTGYELLKVSSALHFQEIQFFLIGFFVTFFVALLSISFLLKFLKRYSLSVFAFYRIIMAFYLYHLTCL